ncbi:MAG TPA: response regulator [Thermodesulfobacteriota bacterium]|nr:response regulator [Thermodesulfobacteriota bacterium]
MPDKILVVDDEQTIRELLAELLSIEGYEVLLASNGREAIQLAALKTPRLVILDANMPEMNGIETAWELRSQHQTCWVPIIMVTAFAETRTEALHAGVDDFVTKPFKVAELLARVGALLKVGHLENEAERALAYSRELRRNLGSIE